MIQKNKNFCEYKISKLILYIINGKEYPILAVFKFRKCLFGFCLSIKHMSSNEQCSNKDTRQVFKC